MKIRSLSLGLALALLACLLVAPSPAEAQCNITSTGVSMVGPSTTSVYKGLSPTQVCSLTAYNAAGCYPGAMSPMAVSFLAASAMTATMSPACQWVCPCGSVSIDGSDGLPVELLDFSIEEDAVAEEAMEIAEEPSEVVEEASEVEEEDATDDEAPE